MVTGFLPVCTRDARVPERDWGRRVNLQRTFYVVRRTSLKESKGNRRIQSLSPGLIEVILPDRCNWSRV
jgi:hypothetical protein